MHGLLFNAVLFNHGKLTITMIILISVIQTKMEKTNDINKLMEERTKFNSMTYDPTRTTSSTFNISESSPLHIILTRQEKGHCEMFSMRFTDLSITRTNGSRQMIVCVTQLQNQHLKEKCHWVNKSSSLMLNQGNVYGMSKDCGPWYITVFMTSNYHSNTTELSVEVSEPYDPLIFRWLRVITNISFLPGIFIALKRGFYAEAIVYFLNFICSCIYHLCESELHCLKGYSRLHTSDIYASDLSIIVTIWTMTGIKPPQKHVVYLTIAILLQFAVGETTNSDYHFMVNLSFAGLPLCYFFYNNLRRSIKYRHCFPNTTRWIYHIIPGFLLAAIGALVNLKMSGNDNYYYVHCIWHITIMLSVAFLLPLNDKEDEEEEAWFSRLYDKALYTPLI